MTNVCINTQKLEWVIHANFNNNYQKEEYQNQSKECGIRINGLQVKDQGLWECSIELKTLSGRKKIVIKNTLIKVEAETTNQDYSDHSGLDSSPYSYPKPGSQEDIGKSAC